MTNNKMRAISGFYELKILVLGDVMLDIYDFCYSAQSRPSPEKAGKRVYKADKSLKTLGGAGNVAANLAALGTATVLITVCGQDGHYFTLKELAEKANIHHFLIRDAARPTTTKTRLYIDNEYLLRRDDEIVSEITDKIAAAVLREFRREIKGADAVVLSDYHKGFFSNELAQRLIAICNQRDIPVIVDFKPPHKEYFQGAKVIVPNRPEAEQLYTGFVNGGLLEQSTRALYQVLACPNLVVTLGADGLCGFDGEEFFHIPANRVEAIDAVGCGDTVRAALALGFAAGLNLREAVSLANDAAAVVVQKLGTATLSPQELQAFIAVKN